MAYWLIKTEPSSWSWGDQNRDGTTHWSGVRNYQAAANLKAMRTGDKAFFYHSVSEKKIVGIVTISRDYYPDPTDESGRFGMVDVTLDRALPHPVSLEQVKADERLHHLALIRQSRLSVMPIDDRSWEILCSLGGL